jgi:hypothetical protein
MSRKRTSVTQAAQRRDAAPERCDEMQASPFPLCPRAPDCHSDLLSPGMVGAVHSSCVIGYCAPGSKLRSDVHLQHICRLFAAPAKPPKWRMGIIALNSIYTPCPWFARTPRKSPASNVPDVTNTGRVPHTVPVTTGPWPVRDDHHH